MTSTETPEISQEAARAMLAALLHLTANFPDPIIKDGKRLRQNEVACLNGVIISANAAIALAEARA